MNKKYMYSFVALLAIGLVSAGLTGYFSNTVEADFTAEHPILITGFDDDLTDFQGGETRTIQAHLSNEADVEIQGLLQIVISEAHVSINDFEALTGNIHEYVNEALTFSSGDLDLTVEEGFVESIDSSIPGEVTITTGVRTFEVGEDWDASITMTLATDATGTYTIEASIIPLV